MNYTRLKEISKVYFGYNEIARILGITLQSARVTCNRFVKRGLLIRLKRNTYVLREKWDNFDKKEKFMLANIIQAPSYVSLMTALDYYQITTQVQRDFIESIAIYRSEEVNSAGTIFDYSKIDKKLYFGFVKEDGVFMATPEKAFLDAFYLMCLNKYKFDLTAIDFNKLNALKINKLIKKYPLKMKKILESHGYFKKT